MGSYWVPVSSTENSWYSSVSVCCSERLHCSCFEGLQFLSEQVHEAAGCPKCLVAPFKRSHFSWEGSSDCMLLCQDEASTIYTSFYSQRGLTAWASVSLKSSKSSTESWFPPYWEGWPVWLMSLSCELNECDCERNFPVKTEITKLH